MRFLILPLLLFPTLALGGSTLTTLYEKMLGTISTSVEPILENGKLEGCSFIFNVLTRDSSDKIGRFLKVIGNFGLMSMQDKLGLTLKVLVNELSSENSNAAAITPIGAYFVWSDFTTSKDAFVNGKPSDTPGSYFAIYQPSQMENLLASMDNSKVTIAVKLKEGAIDQKFIVDLNVADTRESGERIYDDKSTTRFYQCVAKLVEPGAKGR